MPFTQAVLSAASVGIGCGAGCGSAASAFLTTYVITEGKGVPSSLRQILSFYLGKVLAVLLVCLTGSLLGRSFIAADGTVAGFPLNRLQYGMMLVAAFWLLYSWIRERKGCSSCRHCAASVRLIPSFAVGWAYGLSPCAPLIMVLGYATFLSAGEAIVLGLIFSVASSLIPSLMVLIFSGVFSSQLKKQLGRMLPWIQLIIYMVYLASAVIGLCS